MVKKCSKCGEIKSLDEFYKDNGKYRARCKSCMKQESKKNEKRVYDDKKKAYDVVYREINKEKIKERQKKWRIDNLSYHKEYNKVYSKKNKKNINEKRRIKMNKDHFFKFKANTRSLICKYIREKGYKKKSKTNDILGCDFNTFKNYIENKFTKGMSWDNHGDWHYDHIIPINYAKTEEDVIKLNHYTNFQPLWKKENLNKGSKIIEGTQTSLTI